MQLRPKACRYRYLLPVKKARWIVLIESCYYERASAASERSLFNITEKFQYERPGPARPGPARPETLFRGSYLSNRWAD